MQNRDVWSVVRLLAPALAVVGAVGCSLLLDVDGLQKGSGGRPDGGSNMADQACDQYSIAYCGKLESCAPFYRDWILGDAQTCIDRIKLGCMASQEASDSTMTPPALRACAIKVATLDCRNLFTSTGASACTPDPGTRASGSKCGADGQCSTTHCGIDPNQECGSCSSLVSAGGQCKRDEDCVSGLTCKLVSTGPSASTGVCTQLGGADSSCSITQPCEPSLGCINGRCQPPLSLNAPCTADVAGKTGDALTWEVTHECDTLHGLYCNPAANPKSCQPIKMADAGEACGLVQGSLTFCRKSGTCVAADGGGSVCQSAPQEPAVCSTSVDAPSCLVPAQCIGGFCTVPDPSHCN